MDVLRLAGAHSSLSIAKLNPPINRALIHQLDIFMVIRNIEPKDIEVWADMRSSLWPESDEDHKPELKKYFAHKSNYIAHTFVAVVDGDIVGFIEVNVRNYAEGSDKSSVPYVEAWYVKSEFRNQRVGSALMGAAENWATSKGFTELASDTDEFNTDSINRHLHLGFKETARVVCLLKKIDT